MIGLYNRAIKTFYHTMDFLKMQISKSTGSLTTRANDILFAEINKYRQLGLGFLQTKGDQMIHDNIDVIYMTCFATAIILLAIVLSTIYIVFELCFALYKYPYITVSLLVTFCNYCYISYNNKYHIEYVLYFATYAKEYII